MKQHHVKKGPAKMSKPQGTAVGSGSKPKGGKIKIHTTAPAHEHKLGRATSNYLK